MHLPYAILMRFQPRGSSELLHDGFSVHFQPSFPPTWQEACIVGSIIDTHRSLRKNPQQHQESHLPMFAPRTHFPKDPTWKYLKVVSFHPKCTFVPSSLRHAAGIWPLHHFAAAVRVEAPPHEPKSLATAGAACGKPGQCRISRGNPTA